MAYYEIKQDILQQNLGKHYHFESAEDVCDQFNQFVNLLKEEGSTKEKYTWLDDKDERKYMTDREILDKYISLDNPCLTKAEKKEVGELIYKYKDVFSLRDEIGNPFFYKTFPHERGRQEHLGQRNEKTVLFRYFEGRLFCLFKLSYAYQ